MESALFGASYHKKKEIAQIKTKKSPLEMKNIIVTGNYFDQDYEKEKINPKNSIYGKKKFSSYLSRAFDSPQKSFIKTFKSKNNNFVLP